MKKDSLVGQTVALFLDGGWKLSGEIKKSDEDRLFLESNSELYMVFREKISAVLMNADLSKDSDIKHVDEPLDSNMPKGHYEDDYGYSIPFDMLTKEAQREGSDSEYSIHFSPISDNEKTGISFTVEKEDDTEK